MNKRQLKKRTKTLNERFSFFNKHIRFGRGNGKTTIIVKIYYVAFSKKYRPFKSLKNHIYLK